jgi:hypothetical protein
MVSGYLDRIKGMLVQPQATLKSLQDTPLRSAFIHFLLVWGIFAALFCLGGLGLNLFVPTADPWYPVEFVVLVFAGWLFFGLVVHAVLRVVSGQKSPGKTCRIVLYAATPLAAIGWMPVIGGLSFIWGLLLMNQGLVEYHGISGRTAAAVLFLSLVLGIMAFGMAYYFLPLAITLIIR